MNKTVSAIQFIINMDVDFFEKMSKEEADAFLRRFLETESLGFKKTAKRCAADGLKMDYSIKSIEPFMRWILKKLVTVRMKPDPAVSEWIRNTDSYDNSLLQADESSIPLVMQVAYYLGESFVRNYRTLRWGTGDIETAEGNMPAVIGFQHGLELTPIEIAENLLLRVAAEPKKVGDFKKAIESWVQDV